jgi:hypothetical protein
VRALGILPFKSTSVEIACFFSVQDIAIRLNMVFLGLTRRSLKRWLASNHLETIVKDVEKVKLRGFHIYGIAFSDPFFKNFIRRKRVVTAYICYNRYILIVRKDDLFEKR